MRVGAKMSPEYQRAWGAKNRSKVAAYNAKKRAKVAAAVARGELSAEDLRAKQREAERSWSLRNREAIRTQKRGYYMANVERIGRNRLVWRERNRDKVIAWNRNRQLVKHGITLEEYERRMAEQGGKCGICGCAPVARKSRSGRMSEAFFCVDHCHSTGRVRGLLCISCNLVLGNARDNVATLRRAADYLEQSCAS